MHREQYQGGNKQEVFHFVLEFWLINELLMYKFKFICWICMCFYTELQFLYNDLIYGFLYPVGVTGQGAMEERERNRIKNPKSPATTLMSNHLI